MDESQLRIYVRVTWKQADNMTKLLLNTERDWRLLVLPQRMLRREKAIF